MIIKKRLTYVGRRLLFFLGLLYGIIASLLFFIFSSLCWVMFFIGVFPISAALFQCMWQSGGSARDRLISCGLKFIKWFWVILALITCIAFFVKAAPFLITRCLLVLWVSDTVLCTVGSLLINIGDLCCHLILIPWHTGMGFQNLRIKQALVGPFSYFFSRNSYESESRLQSYYQSMYPDLTKENLSEEVSSVVKEFKESRSECIQSSTGLCSALLPIISDYAYEGKADGQGMSVEIQESLRHDPMARTVKGVAKRIEEIYFDHSNLPQQADVLNFRAQVNRCFMQTSAKTASLQRDGTDLDLACSSLRSSL